MTYIDWLEKKVCLRKSIVVTRKSVALKTCTLADGVNNLDFMIKQVGPKMHQQTHYTHTHTKKKNAQQIKSRTQINSEQWY